MKKIAITGNIGSGKSWICSLFEHCLGIPVYNSDEMAKKMYFLPEVRQRLEKRFGTDFYISDTLLNRKHIAEVIFNDETAQHDLEAILYPALFDDFERWADGQDSDYVLFESALVFEKRLEDRFDAIVLVTATEETRLRRAMLRDRCDAEVIRQRMAKQWPESEKMSRADYVIEHENDDEDEALLEQIVYLNGVLTRSNL
ncbi:MAG: dephospho-CoA kinase [Bacteroidales bacterium]|nr:dephospho-CoA kinase [Bacteroidales bacterium]